MEDLSPTEYMEYCEEVAPQELYEHSDDYSWCDVTLNVRVCEKLAKLREYDGESHLTYYLCEAETNGTVYTFLLRDCRVSSNADINVGDTFVAYGAVTADNILHLASGETRYGVCMELYYAVYHTVTN